MLKTYLHFSILGLLGFLFLLLPLHPFLKMWLGSSLFGGELPMIFVAWKELIVLLLCFLVGVSWILDRKWPKWDILDGLIVGFCTLSLLTGIFFTGDAIGNVFPANIPQILWGVKYGLLFLILFFFLRHYHFSEKVKERLKYLVLGSGALVITFGVLQSIVLPENFLTHFGYANTHQPGELQVTEELPYCHKIENSESHKEFCRIQSTLSGPNQLGAFLLILLPLFFYLVLGSKRLLPSLLGIFFFLGGGVLLLTTWSRSAWIAFFVMGFFFFLLSSQEQKRFFWSFVLFALGIFFLFVPAFFIEYWDALKPFSLLGIGICLLGLLILLWLWRKRETLLLFGVAGFSLGLSVLMLVRTFADTFFWNIIVRPSSSTGHYERYQDGVQWIWNHPLGLGLGDAGPASAKFAAEGQTGFLPESWYLQVGLESGILGLFLFLGILGFTLWYLLKAGEQALFLTLIGLMVTTFFLHSWESSAVALTFWGLAGVMLAPKEQEKSWWKKIWKKGRGYFS